MLYEEIDASCLIKVDVEGNVLFNASDYNVNAAGFVIHSAIHMARHDVDCVAHTHTPAGMAVSAMECGLLPLAQTSMRFLHIAYHDFEGIADDIGERERLVADLGQHEAMVLRNHGLLVVGRTIPATFNLLFRLERACEVQVMALSCNTKLIYPPQDVLEATFDKVKPRPDCRTATANWPGRRCCESSTASDPSYNELHRVRRRRGLDTFIAKTASKYAPIAVRARALPLIARRRGSRSLDRMDLDRPQATEPQHFHLKRPADPVAIERADQIVDAVDADTIEPDHDIAGQQPCLRRRPVRLDLRQQRAHGVVDAGDHRMPSRDRRGLAGHADIGTADIAVADDLRQHELRGVAGDRKADALRAVDDGGVDADHLGRLTTPAARRNCRD